MTSSLGNISLVGGLIKATGLTSVLGTTAAAGAADGSRTIKAGAINVLDLGALLNGLGIPLTALPLDAVSTILGTLGVPVPGLPSSLTLDELRHRAQRHHRRPAGADRWPGRRSGGRRARHRAGRRPRRPRPADPRRGRRGRDRERCARHRCRRSSLICSKTALGLLDNISLLKVGGIEVGTITKAADTVAASAADIVAKIGSINVGGLTLPGLDLGSTLSQVTGVLNTVNGTLSSVLGSISPDLANLVKVGLFEKDSATGVTKDGGYIKSLAGVTALRPRSSRR